MKFFLLWFPQKLVFQTYYEMQLLTKEPRWLAKIQHVRKRYTFWQKPFIPSPNFWSRVVLQNKFLILTKLLKFTSKQKYFKFQNWNTDEENDLMVEENFKLLSTFCENIYRWRKELLKRVRSMRNRRFDMPPFQMYRNFRIPPF